MRLAVVGALLALVWALYYGTSCLFWPYGACRRCKGGAKHRGWWGGGFRLCRRCDGSGRRLRIGRRFINYMSSKRKDAR